MEKDIKTKLEEITVRQDLIFSVLSNDYLAVQAMQVYQSVMKGVQENPDNKELKNVAEKSLESYKFHGENVNDAISYYYDIFGEEANLGVHAIMKKRGVDRETGTDSDGIGNDGITSPVANVEGVGKRTSEKV